MRNAPVFLCIGLFLCCTLNIHAYYNTIIQNHHARLIGSGNGNGHGHTTGQHAPIPVIHYNMKPNGRGVRSSSSSDQFDESSWPTFVNQNMTLLKSSFSKLDDFCEIQHRPVALARWLSGILKKIVLSRTTFVSGLDVVVLAARNLAIARGRVNTIEMKFDKIIFNDVHVSGGGRLIIKDLNLRMRRFLFRRKQSIRRPYVLYCDLLFTQLDIIKSTFIRGLIQLLVDTILGRAFDQAKVGFIRHIFSSFILYIFSSFTLHIFSSFILYIFSSFLYSLPITNPFPYILCHRWLE